MRSPILAIIFIGIVSRIGVWAVRGVEIFDGAVIHRAWADDCTGVLSDPLFSLLWDHARPPMFALRKIIECAIADVMAPWHFQILLVSACDILAAALLFATLRRLSVDMKVGLAAAIAWSICLIAWEYYRIGSNHNHLNIGAVMLLTYMVVRRVQSPGRFSDIGFGFAAAFLVAAYGPALILAPILAVVSAPWPKGARQALISVGLALTLPALVFVSVGYKNYKHFGVFSTSSYLSVNLAQFAYISLGYDMPGEKLLSRLDKLDASPWWRWCFDRRKNDRTKPHPYLKGLHGQCLDFQDLQSLQIGLNAARERSDSQFVASLSDDLVVAKDAPWAMRFTDVAMASKTEVVFNNISKRLYEVMIKTEPLALLRTFLMANRSFMVWGPLMFDGVHHEPQLVLAPKPINLAATALGYFLIAGIIGLFAHAVWFVTRVIRIVIAQGPSGVTGISPTEFLIVGMFFAFLFTGTVMNAVSCCENGRQFQSLSPIPLICGIAGLAHLARKKFSGLRQ